MNSSWELKKIEDVATVVSGGTPSREVKEFWGGEISWATPTDITRDNRRTLKKTKEQITKKGLQGSSTKLLPAGTLLMTSRATLVEIKIAETEVCTNQGFKSLIPFASIDPWFLFYQMKNHKIKYESYGIGTTFLEVNKGDTDRFTIPIPKDKSVQTKIAKILTTIDNVIEKTEKAIAKYEAVKQGMMHDLFTRGIGEDGQLRPRYEDAPELYKESELGWIPKEWDVKSLEELADVKGGKRLPAGEEFANGITPYPYVRVTDMRRGTIRTKGLVYVKPKIQRLIKNYTISKDDLYITIAGTLGVVGEVPEVLHNAQLTENAAKIVIKDFKECSKQFLKFFFQSSHYPKQLYKEIGIGGGVPKLALHRILSLTVVKPKYNEQLEIEKRAKKLDLLIENERQALSKQIQLKQGLMQDLLTGKVPVKTDPINV
jgi:type I restriction enzyme S subunit